MAQVKRKVKPVQAIRKPAQQQGRYPVPVGGLNFHESLLTMQPTEALVLDNFIPRPSGIEIRKGWRFWVPETYRFNSEVRTILAYVSQNPANSRIFACPAETPSKIYNVTTQNAAPALSLTPSTNSITPGEWYSVNYATPGGTFLCAVAEGAGYYTYGTGGWTEVVTGSGVGQLKFPDGDTTTAKQLTFCWTWKNRLWFLKNDSSTAYYLPVSSITGALTAFDLGPQLLHGGAMNFATAWTYDSGQGIDDALVFVSTQGDVLVYQGTDPSSAANFSLKGVWYIGRFPVGRRGFSALGGDIVLVTELGLIRMSDLVSGRLHQATLGSSDDSFFKLNPRLASVVTSTINSPYWFVLPYNVEEIMVLGSPYINPDSGVRQSFLMNSITNTWATISDMDLMCAEVYYGQMIVGTRDGFVAQLFYGYNDRTSADGTDLGTEVTGRYQTAFNDLGDPTMNKRLLRTRLYGIADGIPSMIVKFVEEYDLTTRLSTASPLSILPAIWDLSTWDNSTWAANQASLRKWIGICGFGRKLSMLLAIRGQGRTVLSDYEILYETGINL